MIKLIDFLKKYYLSLIFILFVALMSINYIWGVVYTTVEKYNNYYNDNDETSEYITEFIPLLEEEGISLYPSDKSSNKLKKALSLTIETMEYDIDFFHIKDTMLNFNAWCCNATGMKHIPGTTYFKSNSGMLSYITNTENMKSNIDTNFRLLGAFKEEVDTKNIPILYIACPNKDYIMASETPIGLSEATNLNLNTYTSEILKSMNINHLNLWSNMEADNITPEELFYNTDHHWKSEYGIYAAKAIATQLNDEYGYNIDTSIYNTENYTTEVYYDSLLGSIGINSTEAYTSAEDFTVYLPNEKVNYSFTIPSKDIDLQGGFDVFIDNARLQNTDNYPFNAYASYIYANSAYISIENHDIKDEHKVLVIKDSYANIVIPYLAQTIGNVDVIDIRSSQEDYFKDSVLELIENNNYDTILFINSSPSEFEALFRK